MPAVSKKPFHQIERLPMDRELREDIRAGVDHLSDAEAEEQARRLETALDRIPGPLVRLHRASAATGEVTLQISGCEEERGSSQETGAPGPPRFNLPVKT